jgi:hypothetical protein
MPKISTKNKTVGGYPYNPPMVQASNLNKSIKTINFINFFKHPVLFLHKYILYLNNSKFFAGIIMILLNVGSKFISINFSKSTEEYLKYTLSKQILVFAMAWMATRDIYTALVLTAIFIILSEHLFNENSNLCIVPHSKRILHKIDAAKNSNNQVTEEELTTVIGILEKVKIEQIKERINKTNSINICLIK